MRTTLTMTALAALAASTLAFTPTVANLPEPAADCDDVAGREVLTMDGLELEFAAPGVTAPELAATNDVTGDVVTPHRTAHFFLTADAAPSTKMKVTAKLEWFDLPGDYDMFAFDGKHGYEIARSADTNIEDGDTRVEQFTATLDDCQTMDLHVRAWAGPAVQDLKLTITAEPAGELLEDVEPRAADDRLALYLTGDRPGNLTPPADTVGAEYPFGSTFTTERPSSNVPNLITRPVVGSTIHKNPFQPWWNANLADAPKVTGTPSALVFLSSPTQQHDPGTVFVQLFLNGQEHKVEIDGALLTEHVQPFLVEFPAVDTPVYEVNLQVSTLPIASPNSQSEHLGDANHTVWYDSVQYQSRVFLPVAPAS